MPRLRFSALSLGAMTLVACQQGDGPADPLFSRGGSLGTPSIEGTYEKRIASMDDGTARVSHHVRTPDGVFELQMDPDTANTIDLQYETRVRAWGDPLDEHSFELDELEVLAGPPVPLIDPEKYPYRRIATVLLFWNPANQGPGNNQVTQDMFISADSTNVFYGENSYGKETIAGDVFGPYQIDDPGDCYADVIADRGMQAFVDHGHDPEEYRQFMWAFYPGLACGWGGLANVGSVEAPAKYSWYNGNLGCVVRAQEIGHNYGMGHSHSYDCPNGVITPTMDGECEHVEYGDPHDPMGGGCDHMNVAQKAYMGWLEDCNVVTTETSGTFNLLPTELPCNGTQALLFPSGDGRFYYLEYRQNYGVDAGLEGVVLHISGTFNYSPSPYILEAASDGGYFMQPGDSFTDPTGDASFTVVDMFDTHAVVDVTIPGGSGEPTCRNGDMPEMADGAIGSLECSAEPWPLDTAAPTVSISYPADGDVFEPGSDFTVTVDAQDDRLITEVELYVQIVGVDDMPQPYFKVFEAPYEYDVTDIPEGTYIFGAAAFDGPNVTYSDGVTVEIKHVENADTSGGSGDGGDSTTAAGDETGGSSDGGGQDSSTTGDPGVVGDDKGCACNQTRPSGAGLLLGLGGLVLGLRSRRRRR
ncbi:MAG: hypothetical protein K1X88_07755 [Nannocystaceae bacterium]|nr:hypothetical protein [Nannocystaceae bacterium]